MAETRDRRRWADRERYLTLRFYARLLSFFAFGAAAGGVVFAVLIVLYAEANDKLRYSRAFLSVLLGGLSFVILRATAQVIYLLFDVARHARATREALEKARAPAGEERPKSPVGD